MQSLHNIWKSYIQTTSIQNLAFHKVASFHQHYSPYTLQTYHDQEHQFRSWPMQMTSPSHLHTQARVQPRNTSNHTYIRLLPGQNKTTCTLLHFWCHKYLVSSIQLVGRQITSRLTGDSTHDSSKQQWTQY